MGLIDAEARPVVRAVIDEIKERLPQYMMVREQFFSLLHISKESQEEGWTRPLEPPIPIEAIEFFEHKTGIRFPDGLRMFLSEIGSGAGRSWDDAGVGPELGIVSVKIEDDACIVLGEDISEPLSQPFPFTEAYNTADWEELHTRQKAWEAHYYEAFPPFRISQEGKTEFVAYDQAEIEAYCEKSEPQGRREYYDQLPFTGAMPICGIGCGDYYFVVVTGDAAGEVWVDYRDNWGGYEPVLDEDGSHIDFAKWYLQWLEEATTDMRSTVAKAKGEGRPIP